MDSTIGETIPPPISPGQAALLNARSAKLGRKVLLTKEEEARVQDLMADMMVVEDIEVGEGNEREESKALEGKESFQNPFQLQAQTKEVKEIELRLKEFIERREHCRSSAISGLVFSERKNAFVDAADSTDADVKSSHKDNRSAGDDRPRRSSTSLSKSEEKDVLPDAKGKDRKGEAQAD